MNKLKNKMNKFKNNKEIIFFNAIIYSHNLYYIFY